MTVTTTKLIDYQATKAKMMALIAYKFIEIDYQATKAKMMVLIVYKFIETES